jgi:hypothetical protein
MIQFDSIGGFVGGLFWADIFWWVRPVNIASETTGESVLVPHDSTVHVDLLHFLFEQV